MPHFGFTPSDKLLNKVQMAIKQKNSAELLYPLRDEIALLINEELINAVLTQSIACFPTSEKKETAEKLAQFIKSSVAVLLKQLLSKAPNSVVKQSIEFSQKHLFKDQNGEWRIGEPLENHLVTNLKNDFAELKAGHKVNLHILAEHYKFFADETIRHFMHDFNKTLELGMIKRKTADMACTAITRAVHIAIDKIIPKLNKAELLALAESHDNLFLKT